MIHVTLPLIKLHIVLNLLMLGIGLMCTSLIMIGITLIYDANDIETDHSESKILKYLPKANLVALLLLTLSFGIDII